MKRACFVHSVYCISNYRIPIGDLIEGTINVSFYCSNIFGKPFSGSPILCRELPQSKDIKTIDGIVTDIYVKIHSTG